jgi:hypothetical protein
VRSREASVVSAINPQTGQMMLCMVCMLGATQGATSAHGPDEWLRTRAVDGIVVSHGFVWVAAPPSQ